MTTTGQGLEVDIRVPGRLQAAFTAGPGEVIAVLGPNGAGKSTLVSAIAGLVDGVGTVRVAEAAWSAPGQRPTLVRDRRAGVVFQGQKLFPHLTALDNVAFGLRARGRPVREARSQALAWLARFGLAELAERRPAELSGGQAQRVAIARTMVTDPAVLLLDEPFAGLDIGVATALRLDLREHLAAYDGVCLLVTHDALDAFVLADRVLVLDEGRIAQYDAPAEVAARPQTAHVARLAGLNVVRRADELLAFRPSDVTVSLASPVGSARNRWRGQVSSVMPYGDAIRVGVAASDGAELVADLTPAAGAELQIVPGREVWLTVKATAVATYAASAL